MEFTYTAQPPVPTTAIVPTTTPPETSAPGTTAPPETAAPPETTAPETNAPTTVLPPNPNGSPYSTQPPTTPVPPATTPALTTAPTTTTPAVTTPASTIVTLPPTTTTPVVTTATPGVSRSPGVTTPAPTTTTTTTAAPVPTTTSPPTEPPVTSPPVTTPAPTPTPPTPTETSPQPTTPVATPQPPATTTVAPATYTPPTAPPTPATIPSVPPNATVAGTNASSSGYDASSSEAKANGGPNAAAPVIAGESPAMANNGGASTSGDNQTTVIAVVVCAGVVLVGIVVLILLSATRRRRRKSDVNREDTLATTPTTAYTQDRFPSQPQKKPSNGVAAFASASVPHDSLEDWMLQSVRISLEEIYAGELLSRGAFGEVLKAFYKGETVVVKRLRPERRNDPMETDLFAREIRLMATLQHPNIVHLIGAAWDAPASLCAVTEYMEGGDLRSLLTTYDAKCRPTGFDSQKTKIALDVIDAIAYLHSRTPTIIHRDLKSKNVVLSRTLEAKLTDFGVSRERRDTTMTAATGSSLWMAPEVMVGGRYDEKADVFSFGVMLSELDTHLLPYAFVREGGPHRHLPEVAILNMVQIGSLTVSFTGSDHDRMVQIARACVSVDPRNRPTAEEVRLRIDDLFTNYII